MADYRKGEIWRKVKELWYLINKPDSQGFYYCHYCGKPLTNLMVTLDHIKQASRYPDTRFDISNLIPACEDCNQHRGDTDYDVYTKRLAKYGGK